MRTSRHFPHRFLPSRQGSLRRIVFCVLIGIPLLYIATSSRSKFPYPNSIGAVFFLPREIKFYFAHDFPPRHALASLHRQIMTGLRGEQTVLGDVIEEEDGWMFFRPAVLNGDLPQDTLRSSLTKHESRAKFCARLGIAYYVVPAPAKENLYVEHLPVGFQRFINPSAKVTQLQRYLATKSDVINCVFLLESLRKWKTKGELFFKTDVHWNNLGAFAASQETIRQIMPDHGLRLAKETPYQISYKSTAGGNLAQMLGVRNEVRERYPMLIVADGRHPTFADGSDIRVDAINFTNFDRSGMHTVCLQAEMESALVFHDSFGAALVPFLGRYFQSCSFYWDDFSEDLVTQKRPRIVIDIANTF